MKMCLCVKPDLDEKDGFAHCKLCDNWFNTKLWKDHWAKKVESAIEKDKISRNDPCPCKSGKKYKKCCIPVGHRRWIKRNSPPKKREKSITDETIIERERRIENETNKK